MIDLLNIHYLCNVFESCTMEHPTCHRYSGIFPVCHAIENSGQHNQCDIRAAHECRERLGIAPSDWPHYLLHGIKGDVSLTFGPNYCTTLTIPIVKNFKLGES